MLVGFGQIVAQLDAVYQGLFFVVVACRVVTIVDASDVHGLALIGSLLFGLLLIVLFWCMGMLKFVDEEPPAAK